MAEKPKKPCATDESTEIDEQLKLERIESVPMEGDGAIGEFRIEASARKEAGQALRESEERFRTMAALLELAPVLVRDMESRIVLWTQGAERLYGFSKEEALGRVSHDLFQTEFPEGKARVDESLGSVGKWEGELVHRKRDGDQLVVASQQIVYFDSSARPARILEVNADITEQKKAEAALNRSAEQLCALAAGLQQAREEEALRIARELHDQLGRCLTAIKMDVDGIRRELSRNGLVDRSVQALFARAQRTSQTVSESCCKLHRASQNRFDARSLKFRKRTRPRSPPVVAVRIVTNNLRSLIGKRRTGQGLSFSSSD